MGPTGGYASADVVVRNLFVSYTLGDAGGAGAAADNAPPLACVGCKQPIAPGSAVACHAQTAVRKAIPSPQAASIFWRWRSSLVTGIDRLDLFLILDRTAG